MEVSQWGWGFEGCSLFLLHATVWASYVNSTGTWSVLARDPAFSSRWPETSLKNEPKHILNPFVFCQVFGQHDPKQRTPRRTQTHKCP